jgi:DNA-binding transcriptional LysR family regulator
MSLQLRQLRYFVAVAEELSFTRAARRLFMTQQPLSEAIKKLEEEIGVPLFERSTRKVELTKAGESLLEEAREILARTEEAPARARRAAGQTLVVGIHCSAYSDLSSALTSSFREQHPGIAVEIRTFDMTAPSAGVAQRAVDVGLVREPQEARGLVSLQLFDEERVVVVGGGSELAEASSLTLNDLVDEAWLVPRPATDGSHPSRFRDSYLPGPRSDGRPWRIGAEASTVDEGREYVAQGLAVALTGEGTARYYARPDVRHVRVEGLEPTTLSLAWHKADEARARAFVAWAQDYLAERAAAAAT